MQSFASLSPTKYVNFASAFEKGLRTFGQSFSSVCLFQRDYHTISSHYNFIPISLQYNFLSLQSHFYFPLSSRGSDLGDLSKRITFVKLNFPCWASCTKYSWRRYGTYYTTFITVTCHRCLIAGLIVSCKCKFLCLRWRRGFWAENLKYRTEWATWSLQIPTLRIVLLRETVNNCCNGQVR